VYSRPPIRVKDILALLAAGAPAEGILADYPYLEPQDIVAALQFGSAQADHAILRSCALLDERFDASHVKELGLERASDRVIWARALAEGAIIVTKDEGLATRQILERSGPVILWVRCGNTTKREILSMSLQLMPSVSEALNRVERLVEIL
jgi:predicted nuclease of predicted toxin-antitoxin system